MPTKPPAPSDLADKFMLRMPDGMRDDIAAAAKANNRSMNAEIIARLTASLRPIRASGDPEPRSAGSIDISLDTNGMPISWDEIWVHLEAIQHSRAFDMYQLSVNVITPQVLSSQGRQKEADDLARRYERLLGKT